MNYFHHPHNFSLEGGGYLPGLDIAYKTYGELNENKDNVVWVCHALTANADAADWWPGVVGTGHIINPEKYFIVCANIIGSCYGSTGPLSTNPETNKPYYNSFPFITIRDMVNAHILPGALRPIRRSALQLKLTAHGETIQWVQGPKV